MTSIASSVSHYYKKARNARRNRPQRKGQTGNKVTYSTLRKKNRFHYELWDLPFSLRYEAATVGSFTLAVHLVAISVVLYQLTAHYLRTDHIHVIGVIILGDLFVAILSSVALTLSAMWLLAWMAVPWLVTAWFHVVVTVVGTVLFVVRSWAWLSEVAFGSFVIIGIVCAWLVAMVTQLHHLLLVHLFVDEVRRQQAKKKNGFKSFKISM